MTEEIKQELKDIIDKIAEYDRKRLEIRKEQRQIRDRISVIRAKLVIEVVTANDDKGKRIYSNDRLREAALTLKLDENQEFQNLRAKQRELDDQEQGLAIEHNRLVDHRTLSFIELGLLNPTLAEK